MKKTYIEAQYRITDQVYNHGYICIDGDSINAIFTSDYASIVLYNGSLIFYLEEFEPEYNSYYEVEKFVSINEVDCLESPCTYILKSNSDVVIYLDLIKKISDTRSISNTIQAFEDFFGK